MPRCRRSTACGEQERNGVLVIKASHGGQRLEKLLESSGKAQSVHC